MKLLIISHNPVSEQSNMGKTFLSLFSGFAPSELCQLFIYPTVPDSPVCGSWFRVTDKDVLVSRLHRGEVGGVIPQQRIGTVHGAFENASDVRLYRDRRNKSPLRQLLRDLVWRVSRWYTPELRSWLEQEAPDCIFAAPGGAKFLYDIALRIAEDMGIPVVSYLCDEYYFVHPSGGLLDNYRLRLLRGKMEKLLMRSSHLVVISPELKEQYEACFGLPVTVLMTGAGIPIADAPRLPGTPESLCYFGNIRCGRYRSLAQIGMALDSLNQELGRDWRLRIYTSERDPQILSRLTAYRCVDLEPFLTGEEFRHALQSAPLLLHVEDFAPENADKTRNSISTKIADSLASGVPLVAFGPAGIASMEHLRRNDCGLLADCPQALAQLLRQAFLDPAAGCAAAENGLKTAGKFHSSPATTEHLRKILAEVKGKIPGRILQINNFYGENSTGKLTRQLHEGLRASGYRITTVYGRGEDTNRPGVIRLCPEWYAKANSLLAQLTGMPYGGCVWSTNRLLRMIRREKPDIVHLQCINGNFVNIYRLIRWLKRKKIKTVISLHAEFLYTANCSHAFFCEKWKTGCKNCPNPAMAVRSIFFDRTKASWRKMRRAFAGFERDCCLCPVSDWTKNRAMQGDILKSIPMITVCNGVDTNIFCPAESTADTYILHVTAHFSTATDHLKGGRWVLELAKRFPDIPFLIAGAAEPGVLLPPNVTLLGKITDQKALAQLYRNAKLTVLTSRRETFSMPCAESLCCGTPVVGFRAGGPEEIGLAEYTEFVPYGDLDALEAAVRKWLTAAPAAISGTECYSTHRMVDEFGRIYEKLYESGNH